MAEMKDSCESLSSVEDTDFGDKSRSGSESHGSHQDESDEPSTRSDLSNGDEDDSDDDVKLGLASLELSGDTMRALLEFLAEKKERDEKLQMIAEGNIPDEFEENWVSYVYFILFKLLSILLYLFIIYD